jgi:hypothetical protein
MEVQECDATGDAMKCRSPEYKNFAAFTNTKIE